MRALIVEDGWQRGALAATRSLGRAGWDVGIGSPRPGFAAASRFSAEWHDVPPPEEDPDAFLAAIQMAGEYDLVFGAGDAEVLVLSERRDEVDAAVPYGPHDGVARAFDKVALAEAAQRAGLAIPSAGGEPLVVKPRHTTVRAADGSPLRLRAEVAATSEEAAARVEYLESVGAEAVTQAYVEGDLVAFVALADRESRLVAGLQQRASVVSPGGGSVRAETVAIDPILEEKVTALLSDLAWFGIAQVQFQQPLRGEPVLIDLNGRFYGSMALAVAAGVDLPAMWGDLAQGRPVQPVSAKIGVRYHSLEPDLRRRSMGSLPYAVGAAHGLWDPTDPRPALEHVGRLVRRLAR